MIVHYTLTQYSVKKILKKFGQKGANCIVEEMQQMLNTKAFVPVDPKYMTPEKMVKVLEGLFVIKEKKDGRVKG